MHRGPPEPGIFVMEVFPPREAMERGEFRMGIGGVESRMNMEFFFFSLSLLVSRQIHEIVFLLLYYIVLGRSWMDGWIDRAEC